MRGQAGKCPRCGELLRLGQGEGHGNGQRTGSAPKTEGVPEEPPARAEPAEPSLWRNPALYIGLAVVTALVVVFLIAVRPGPEPTAQQEPKPTATALAGTEPAEPLRASVDEPVPAASKASPAPEPSATPQKTTLSGEEVFAKASAAVVKIEAIRAEGKAVGTGFFVSADGLVVTNHHVLKGAQSVRVVLPNGSSFSLNEVVVRDEAAELALLRVPGSGLPFLKVSSEPTPPSVGARVYAIGNPQGLNNTLSQGVVSGDREKFGRRLIQTTASVSPGSSGGPLLDGNGCVVGVMTFIQTDAERLSQNLNFAVPSTAVTEIMSKAAGSTPKPLQDRRAGGLDEPFMPTRLHWIQLVCKAYSDVGGIVTDGETRFLMNFDASTHVATTTYTINANRRPGVRHCAQVAWFAKNKMDWALKMIRTADPSATGEVKGVWFDMDDGRSERLPKVEPLEPGR